MSDKLFQINPESLERKESKSVIEWEKTIIFAPHPDDESLGCGGAIALLRQFGLSVRVITLSDGTLSHPNSIKFPAEKLRDLREREMTSALEILGVAASEITFLRYPDRSVPGKKSPDFDAAIKIVEEIFEVEKPQTILVPWRRDPHPDHRATWEIVSAAMKNFDYKTRLLEYPIWLWELAEEKDLPVEKEISAWRLDIAKVVSQKQAAINAHTSQTTDLIDDDPNGFRLSPEILKHFDAPFEIYLEEIK